MGLNIDPINPFYIFENENPDSGRTASVLMPEETAEIHDGIVVLKQIPDLSYGIVICDQDGRYFRDATALHRSPTQLAEDQFLVLDRIGFIVFHPARNNETITIKEYYGKGFWLIDASRIMTELKQNQADGTVSFQTLEEYYAELTKQGETLQNTLDKKADRQTPAGGFAGGRNAKAENAVTGSIDAIQLGTGTNSNPNTLQVYNHTLLSADGTIPDERLGDEQLINIFHRMKALGLLDGVDVLNIKPYSIAPLSAWSFSKDNTDWSTVTLPHTCNTEDGVSSAMYRGLTYYKNSIPISSGDLSKSIYLVFDGAGQKSGVYVNDVLIASYQGGYTPFTVSITEHIQSGSNTIKVICDNTADLDLIPVSADFNFNNGLHRNVYLVKRTGIAFDTEEYGTDRFHVKQTSVSDSSAAIEYWSRITNDGAMADCTVTAELIDADGTVLCTDTQDITVPESGYYDYNVSFTVSNPHLWNGKPDPYLYTSKITLKYKGAAIDTVQCKTGLRYFSMDPGAGFMLNGAAYSLRGAAMHQDYPGKMSAMQPADFDGDYAIVEDLGCNFLRLAHYPHSAYAFDLCDQKGLIVQTEIPWINHCGKNATQAYHDCIEANLRSMIKNYYNHPSIIFWGLSNELNGSHWKSGSNYIDPQGGYDCAKAIAWNNEFYALAKQLDSTRYTGFVSHDATFSGNLITGWDADFIGANIYRGWYGGNFEAFGSRIDSVRTAFPYWAVTEYGAGANPSAHSDTPLTTTNTGSGGARHDEEYANLFHESYLEQIQARPWIIFTSIWALFDFAVSGRNEGGTPNINDKGIVTRDRTIKKDPYYLYKAAWSPEDVVYITSRRFTERTSENITIKVYSNCDKLELYVDEVLAQTMMNATKTGLVWEFDAVDFSESKHKFTVKGYRNNALVSTDETEFTTTVFGGPPDPSELTALIGTCEADLNSVSQSEDGYDLMSDVYWVRPSVYTTFEAAVTAARDVLETATLQSQFDQAVTELSAAKETFLSSKQPGKIKDGYFNLDANVAYVPLNHVNENTTMYVVFEGGFNYVAGNAKMLLTSKSPTNAAGTSGISILNETGASLASFHVDSASTEQTGVNRQYMHNDYNDFGISRPTFKSIQMILYRGDVKWLADGSIGAADGWVSGRKVSNRGTVQPFSGYLYINIGDLNPVLTKRPEEFATQAELTEALSSGILKANYYALKIRRLMVWEDTKLTSMSEILTTDVKPNIDLRATTDGLWKNLGTNGDVVYSAIK